MTSFPTLRPSLRHASAAALLAGALALTGCGGGDDKKDPAAAPSAASGAPVQAVLADDVPADAVAFGEADIRPEGATKAGILDVTKAFGITDPGGELIKALDLDGHDLASGKSFESAILPTLGDHVGGFLIARPAKKGEAAGVSGALVAEVRDATALRKALDADLRKSTKLDVDGQEVYREPDGGKDPFAIWVGDRTFSVGKEDAVRKAVAAASGPDLAGAARYRSAIGQVRATDQVGVAWLDLQQTEALDAVLSELDSADLGSSRLSGRERRLGERLRSSTSGLPQIDASIGVALEARPGRIGLQLGGTQPKELAHTTSGGADAVAALPSGSWFAAGLGELRDSLLPGTTGKDPKQAAQQLSKLLGVDVPEQLLSDIGDVRAITLGARGDSLLSLGGAVVVQTKDAAGSGRLMDALAGVLGDKTSLKLRSSDIPGADKGLVGQLPGLPLQVAIGTKGDRLAIGLGPDSVTGALEPKGRLGDDPVYARAQALIGGAKPQLLLDASRIGELIGSLPLDRLGAGGVMQVVRRLQLLSAGATNTGATTWRGSAVLQYGPAPATGSSAQR